MTTDAKNRPGHFWKASRIDGNCVQWERYGIAAKGEPSIVSKVEKYASEYEALSATLRGPKNEVKE